MDNTFNNRGFKELLGLDDEEKIHKSSISKRLSKIDSNYFKEIYEYIYGWFSELYSNSYNLIRVDSTMVTKTHAKLSEEID